MSKVIRVMLVKTNDCSNYRLRCTFKLMIFNNPSIQARTRCSALQCLTQLDLTHFQVWRLCIVTDRARKNHTEYTYWSRWSVGCPRRRKEHHLAGRLSFKVPQTYDQRQAVFTERSKADVEWLSGLGQRLHVAHHFDKLTVAFQHLHTSRYRYR